MKVNVEPGTRCEFNLCATGKPAVHKVEHKNLCAFHSPYDVEGSVPQVIADSTPQPSEKYDYDLGSFKRRRYQVIGRDGNWLIMDGIHKVGWAATRTEARILRRKMEVGKR